MEIFVFDKAGNKTKPISMSWRDNKLVELKVRDEGGKEYWVKNPGEYTIKYFVGQHEAKEMLKNGEFVVASITSTTDDEKRAAKQFADTLTPQNLH